MIKCCKCNETVYDGFHAAGEYYCSAECLYKDFTEKEWSELYEADCDEYFWSTFEE